MRKWIAGLGMAWLLWSDLSIIAQDDPLDTIVLRWLARVPRFRTDRIQAGSYATAEECKAALERHMSTLRAINDNWSAGPFEREADMAAIQYFRNGAVLARAALACSQR